MGQDDEAARFTALYRAYYPVILSTCTRRLGDRTAAEDATQEVFRVAWQRFAREDPNLAWLYAITRNVVGNSYRRSARPELSTVEVSREWGDSDAMDVRASMMHLRSSDRELLYMAYWEDLTAREIAQVVGTSVPAVWVRLTRARDALRRVLQDRALTQSADPRG